MHLRGASMRFCLQHGVVGGGISIVHMQELTTQLFFGKARIDSQQPVDGETSYNWASITKTMTAIAVLQLRDRGKLSLDDSAGALCAGTTAGAR